MSIFLYRLLWLCLSPLLAAAFAWRLYKGKEHPTRWRERLGHASLPRPTGKLVWLHGASVGETLSLLPLIAELRHQQPQLNILLTSGTRTSADLAAKRLPAGVLHQFVPLDFWPCVKLFMRHWHPTVSVFAESEFWPELLTQAPQPVLVNGRISDRSYPRYQRHAWLYRPVLARFSTCLAQREEDATRLKSLGAHNVIVGGNLKFDAPALTADDKELKALQKRIGTRPVLLAASTHAGEEVMVQNLHQKLTKTTPHLLTIMVPRHPARGAELAAQFGWPARSKNETIQKDTAIYLADTLGEMGLWYRVATVTLIGGSLVPHGGHNPLEPLRLNGVTICGPHMFNFADMLAILPPTILPVAKGLDDLPKLLHTYLNNPKKRDAMRTHIATFMPTLTGATTQAAKVVLANVLNSIKEHH
ncbi:MAG: 3-deoxy-D-manno-octulosonic acid transferase [Alphaproteobacteria bacterium]